MLLENAQPHGFGSSQDGAVDYGASKRRAQGNYRCDVVRALTGNRPRNNASEAVPDEMDLGTGFGYRVIEAFVQPALNQQIGPLGVESYARKKWPVSNPA